MPLYPDSRTPRTKSVREHGNKPGDPTLLRTTVPRTPQQLLAAFQQALLDFSPDDLADLFAADATYEFPFLAPQRGTDRYNGRDAIRAGFSRVWGSLPAPPVTGFRDVRVRAAPARARRKPPKPTATWAGEKFAASRTSARTGKQRGHRPRRSWTRWPGEQRG